MLSNKRNRKISLVIIAIALISSFVVLPTLFAATSTTGNLAVSISSLPSNLSVQIYITGPGAYSSMLTIVGGSSQTLTNLAIGTYNLQPGLANGWRPTQGSLITSVTAGATTQISIPYIQTSVTVQTVQLTVSPSSVPADGVSYAGITANVIGTNGLGISNQVITFSTSLGQLSSNTQTTNTAGGTSVIHLVSSLVGSASVVASCSGISSNIYTVSFTPATPTPSPTSTPSPSGSIKAPTIQLWVQSVSGATVVFNGVTLSGGPTVTVQKVMWNYGDGSTPIASWFPSSKTFNSAGPFKCTVTAYQSDGQVASASVTVTLTTPTSTPTPTPTPTPIIFAPYLSVTEGATSADSSHYYAIMTFSSDSILNDIPAIYYQYYWITATYDFKISPSQSTVALANFGLQTNPNQPSLSDLLFNVGVGAAGVAVDAAAGGAPVSTVVEGCWQASQYLMGQLNTHPSTIEFKGDTSQGSYTQPFLVEYTRSSGTGPITLTGTQSITYQMTPKPVSGDFTKLNPLPADSTTITFTIP